MIWSCFSIGPERISHLFYSIITLIRLALQRDEQITLRILVSASLSQLQPWTRAAGLHLVAYREDYVPSQFTLVAVPLVWYFGGHPYPHPYRQHDTPSSRGSRAYGPIPKFCLPRIVPFFRDAAATTCVLPYATSKLGQRGKHAQHTVTPGEKTRRCRRHTNLRLSNRVRCGRCLSGAVLFNIQILRVLSL